MSLFDRIGLLLRSNLNAAVSSAEDPEKILDQLLIDMRDQFIAAKQQVAVAIADEKRLSAKLQAAQESASGWERKAMLAVQSGNDQLAQEALTRQQQDVQAINGWKTQWEQQKAATEQLRSALVQLNEKIEEAKRKKDLLIARAKRAEAQKTIQNTMSGLSDNSAFDAFGRMSDRVEQMEAEASASADLGAEVSGQNLEDKFKKLEVQQGSSDALLALKAKMGLVPAQATVHAQPALSSQSIDDEFKVPDIGIDVQKVK